MSKNMVSFAAVFTKNGGPDPLCSICFFVEPSDCDDQMVITEYLVQTVIPQLAPIIPNSNPEAVSSAIQNEMNSMEQRFGIKCRGVLTNYNLSIHSKT